MENDLVLLSNYAAGPTNKYYMAFQGAENVENFSLGPYKYWIHYVT